MNPGKKISYSEVIAFHNIIREMDAAESIIRHTVRKSKDGRIDVSDFLNQAASSMRYGMFTPMEVSSFSFAPCRGECARQLNLNANGLGEHHLAFCESRRRRLVAEAGPGGL